MKIPPEPNSIPGQQQFGKPEHWIASRTTGLQAPNAGISHVSVTVNSLDQAAGLYKSAGLVEAARYFVNESELGRQVEGVEFGTTDNMIMRGPNGHVRLVEYRDAPKIDYVPVPTQGPGITHLCIQSPTDKPIFERLLAHGATMVSKGSELIDLAGAGVYYAYLSDAEGTMFEIEHADNPRYETDIWIGHIAIATPDIDRAVEFYGKLLGLDAFRRGEYANLQTLDQVAGLDNVALRSAWIKTENMVVELWQYLNPPTPEPASPPRSTMVPGYTEIAFQVNDIEAELALLSPLNPTILSKILSTDNDRRVYLRDPDGNLLSLRELSDDSPLSISQLHQQFDW